MLSVGYAKAYLWLLEGNARGDRFYRKDGWMCDGVHRVDEVWSVTVHEIRYRRDL